jgi:hypothetical protein
MDRTCQRKTKASSVKETDTRWGVLTALSPLHYPGIEKGRLDWGCYSSLHHLVQGPCSEYCISGRVASRNSLDRTWVEGINKNSLVPFASINLIPLWKKVCQLLDSTRTNSTQNKIWKLGAIQMRYQTTALLICSWLLWRKEIHAASHHLLDSFNLSPMRQKVYHGKVNCC